MRAPTARLSGGAAITLRVAPPRYIFFMLAVAFILRCCRYNRGSYTRMACTTQVVAASSAHYFHRRRFHAATPRLLFCRLRR